MGFNVVSENARFNRTRMADVFSGRNSAAREFCGRYFSPEMAEGTVRERLPQILEKIPGAVFPAEETLGVMSFGKGRVCLIGEHDDHDLCLTLSVPMDNSTICIASITEGTGKLGFYNSDPQFAAHMTRINDLDLERTTTPPWYYYPAATLKVLVDKCGIREAGNYDMNFFFDGSVPFGVPVSSGLSSSAAIENGTMIAAANLLLQHIDQKYLTRANLAELAVTAENSFGNCGRLDQHTSMAPEGRQGVLLDYWHMVRGNWDSAYQFFDIPDQMLLGVVSSDQPASTAQAGYRIRRFSGWAFASLLFSKLINDPHYRPFSEKAREFLGSDRMRAAAPSLRDVYEFAAANNLNPLSLWHSVVMKNFPDAGYSGESILTYLDNTTGNLYDGISEKLAEDAGLTPSQIGSMSDPVFKPKYGMYILGEQGRVKTFYELMKSGQYGSLGSLITSTHYDMSDVYEAGTAKNTEIVNILAELGISGRIVGAGFGGFNMFFILGDTPEQRSETYTLAETALAQHGFNRCFKAPPGCGSAVFETE